jgi:hypothetical protein
VFKSEIMYDNSFIANDKRLDVKLSRAYAESKPTDVLRNFRRATGVKFFTEDAEVSTFRYMVGWSTMTVRDCMDGVAALYQSGWEYEEKTGYELVSFDPSVSSADEESETKKQSVDNIMNKVGESLLAALPALPESSRQKLLSQTGASVSILPNSVYTEMIRGFQIDADRTNKSLPPGYSTADPKQIKPTDINIRLIKNSGRSMEYEMRYSSKFNGGPGFNGTLTITDRIARRRFIESKNSPSYHTRRFSYSKKEALKRPEMKERVSLRLGRVRLTDVCSALSKVHAPGVVSEVRQFLPEVRTVDISDAPLSEALSRLEKIYPNTQWEMRASGMLVLRGPQNLARTRHDPDA